MWYTFTTIYYAKGENMVSKLSLVSIFLPKIFARHEIEALLGCSLKKGIEKAFYFEDQDTYIVYTQFNVITFINYTRDNILKALIKLDIQEALTFEQHCIHQDYPIIIDPTIELTCKVNNDCIILKESATLSLIIIALVVSQSVGLEKYEQDLEVHFTQSRQLFDLTHSFSLLERSKLTKFAKNLILIRHGMVTDLFLLDKPNILWDNEETEHLYNLLASILEIKDRFEIVAYKLSSLKDDIGMAIDLTNQQHSEFLEWIIIIIIAVEMVLGLVNFFK